MQDAALDASPSPADRLRPLRPGRRRFMLAAAAFPLSLGLAACMPSLGLPSTSPAAPTPGDASLATPTPRPSPTGVQALAAARDLSGRLLFVSDADIWLLERGQVHRITPDRISRQPSWSQDGKKIAHVKLATSGSDIWIMDQDGSNSIELTDNEFRPDPRQTFTWHPIWWPDGGQLLYLSEEGAQSPQLWRLMISTRRRTRFVAPLADGLGGLDCPRLSPDGATLLFASFQLGRGMPPSGQPRPQVWAMQSSGAGLRQITSVPDGAYDPAWSPDGRRIAYTARNGVRHDVWVAGADGSNAQVVTTAGTCRAPCWSPDGQWLAYLSAQTGTFEVWAVPAPPPPPAAPAAATTPGSGPAVPAGPGGTASTSFRQITRNGLVDGGSGLAWAR